jgi:hypothetical protein
MTINTQAERPLCPNLDSPGTTAAGRSRCKGLKSRLAVALQRYLDATGKRPELVEE